MARILVTGASGFIAKHIVLKLLEEGYHVRGSLRSRNRAGEVIDAVRPHLTDQADLEERLTFAELDLLSDDGWGDALDGVDALLHTASPFPIGAPDNEDDLIRPAVDGTLRALRAARSAGVNRVVLTSSIASVMEREGLPDGKTLNEDDWSDASSPSIDAYSKSKTLAEQAAWDFVRDEAPELQLTVINPGMVFGPPLDRHFGSSLQLLQRMVRSKDPALPQICMPIVDVRDVAAMHVRSLSVPASIGHRHLGSAGVMWMPDMAEVIAEQFPDRKIATRRAPNWLVRIIALFDKQAREAVPRLDRKVSVDNGRAREVFAMEFIPADEAIRAGAAYLVEHNLV